MATATFTRPLIRHLIQATRRYRVDWPGPTATSGDPTKEMRAERAYLPDIIRKHPEAFHSELDVQTMVRMHRCKH